MYSQIIKMVLVRYQFSSSLSIAFEIVHQIHGQKMFAKENKEQC